MTGNKILLSLFGIVYLAAFASSLMIYPRGRHWPGYGSRWSRYRPRSLYGGRPSHQFIHDDYFPQVFQRPHRMIRPVYFQQRPSLHPFGFRRSYQTHGFRQRYGYSSQPIRHRIAPIWARRQPSFVGPRFLLSPRRTRLPISAPVISNWNRVSGSGWLRNLMPRFPGGFSERRGVDTPPQLPFQIPNVIVPHAIFAFMGDDDDEGRIVTSHLGTDTGAKVPLTVQTHETVDAKPIVTAVKKASGGVKAGTLTGVTGSGTASVDKVIDVGAKKVHKSKDIKPKGIQKILPKIVGKKGSKKFGKAIVAVDSAVKGGHKDRTVILDPVGSSGVGLSGGVAVGAGVAAVVQEIAAIAKAGAAVTAGDIKDKIVPGIDAKSAVEKVKLDLNIKDADQVNIKVGDKVITDALADKSGEIVIAGKVTAQEVKKVVKPAVKPIAAVAAAAAKTSSITGKITGLGKETVILPKKVIPDKKVIAEPVFTKKVDSKIISSDKIVPLKPDIVAPKSPIVKL